MKANEVLNLLRISRKTLHVYAHNGKIRYTVLPAGFYDYNDEDDCKLLNRDIKRKTIIYARVSTQKQRKDLENQIGRLKQWCFMNGYTTSAIYSDIASGISFEKRKGFFETLDEILDYMVEKVVLAYKDMLNRYGFRGSDNLGAFAHLSKNLYSGANCMVRREFFSNGKWIRCNDLNASYNIIKKAVPEAFANGIEGIGLYPRSLSIPQFCGMITSKGGC